MDLISAALADPPVRRRIIWLVVPAAVMLIVYAVLLLLYAVGGMAKTDGPNPNGPPRGGVLIEFKPVTMHADTERLTVEFDVDPSVELTKGESGPLASDLMVSVSPVVGRPEITFDAGQTPAPLSGDISLNGDVEEWPFDQYHSDLTFAAYTGTRQTPIPVLVTFGGKDSHVQGWRFTATEAKTSPDEPQSLIQGYDFDGRRARATQWFGAIIVCVLIALPSMSLFVAVVTYRTGRKVEPTLFGWMSALLFAVVPLRNFLPGAPPAGSWVDASVILWVIVALVASIALYLFSWYRGPLNRPPAESAPD